MMHYWVVGGEYADTRWRSLVPGKEEEWIGPFDDYEEAKAEWQRRAWTTVDSAHVRYRIETHDEDHPPCSD